MNHDPKTLTVEAAAEQLGISRGLAYELARRGEIPVLRLGRRLVVPRAAFDTWLADAGATALETARSAATPVGA